jgi:hypothetical protein
LTNFSDGMARVKINGRYNFIDKTGKLLLDMPVDDANEFSGGLVRVQIKDHWGYVNKEGKYVWLSQ